MKLIHSYLTNRLQRAKANCTYINRQQVKSGVPQGSVLGILLVNFFINDSIYGLQFADNDTNYTFDDSTDATTRLLNGDI